MRLRTWCIGGLAVMVAGLLWYWFRPELLFINSNVAEAFPAGEPRPGTAAGTAESVLLQGRFHGVAHRTQGTAAVYQLAGGRRVLRLTDFETSNGPDVRVNLVAAADASDSRTVTKAGFVELGRLKGNIGDQNYEVPAELDLGRYRAVTIWCKRFAVNFATAPLAAPAETGVKGRTPGLDG